MKHPSLSLCLAAIALCGSVSATAGSPSPEALHSWHESLKNSPPGAEGCFRADYPSLTWQEETCQPAPNYRSNPHFTSADTVGNGYDYSATTSALTESATGSFPAESGKWGRTQLNRTDTFFGHRVEFIELPRSLSPRIGEDQNGFPLPRE